MRQRALFRLAAALILGQALLMGHARADNYPADLIAAQLQEAQRGLDIPTLGLLPGQMRMVGFLGRFVLVYRRTAADLDFLRADQSAGLADPGNAHFRADMLSAFGSSSSQIWTRLLIAGEGLSGSMPYRSADPQWLVLAGWSSESGCALTLASLAERAHGLLLLDACSGARFDLAGRIYAGHLSIGGVARTATFNLAVPPHRLGADGRITVGVADRAALPALPFSRQELLGDGDASSRLMNAARYNDLAAAQEALRQGANANPQPGAGGTPFDAALVGSSLALVQLLLKHGAKPTPYSENAARFVGRTEALELLKKTR